MRKRSCKKAWKKSGRCKRSASGLLADISDNDNNEIYTNRPIQAGIQNKALNKTLNNTLNKE